MSSMKIVASYLFVQICASNGQDYGQVQRNGFDSIPLCYAARRSELLFRGTINRPIAFKRYLVPYQNILLEFEACTPNKAHVPSLKSIPKLETLGAVLFSAAIRVKSQNQNT